MCLVQLPLFFSFSSSSPAVLVVDPKTGGRKAVPSAIDGRVASLLQTPQRVGEEIFYGGWRFRSDLVGEPARSDALAVTRSGSWHRTSDGILQQRNGVDVFRLSGELLPENWRIRGEYRDGFVREKLPRSGPPTCEFVNATSGEIDLRTSDQLLGVADRHGILSVDGTLVLVEVVSGERQVIAEDHRGVSLAGHNLAVLTQDHTAVFLNLNTGERRGPIPLPKPGSAGAMRLRWTSDGSTAIFAGAESAVLVRLSTGEYESHRIVGDDWLGLTLEQFTSLDEVPDYMGMPASISARGRSPHQAMKRFEALVAELDQAEVDEATRAGLHDGTRPSVRMIHDLAADGGEPGALRASRFGGTPDVPAGFEWPAVNGVRLCFFGQVNLADVNRLGEFDLPSSGHLLIFFDAPNAERGYDGAPIVLSHVALEKKVSPAPWPDDLEEVRRFAPRSMMLVPEVCADPNSGFVLAEALLGAGNSLYLPPPIHRLCGWGDFQNAAREAVVVQLDEDNTLPLRPWGDHAKIALVVDGDDLEPDFANTRTIFSWSN